MGRLEAKHWALIAAYLSSTALELAGLPHWSDITPVVVAAMLGQLVTLLTGLFVGAPQNPNLNAIVNPGRRADDPPMGSVSETTRRNLP